MGNISSRSMRQEFKSIVPAFPEGKEIPKVIYQTFRTKDLPPSCRENVSRIQAMNPDWQYQLYDDVDIREFITSNYDDRILHYFNKINPVYGAARADFFRYLLIYKMGGVYLDIKSTTDLPLDEVINKYDSFLLSHWCNGPAQKFEGWGLHGDLLHIDGGEFQQWFIASAPGHPFLKAVIENVIANIDRYNPALHGTGRRGVLRLTGPVAYTLAIFPLLASNKYRYVNSEVDLGLRYTIFSGESHFELFKSHYSELKEPVVVIGVGTRMLAFAIKAFKKVQGYLAGILRRHG